MGTEEPLVFLERDCSDLINGLVCDLTRNGSQSFVERNIFAHNDDETLNTMYDGSVKIEYVDADVNNSTEYVKKRESTCSVPSFDEWPGPYNFQIRLGSNQGRKWEFSEELKKVFINMNAILPVEFKSDVYVPTMFIRALAIYTSPEDIQKPVRRCPNHSHPLEKTNIGFVHMEHLIRCQNDQAEYEEDPESKRLSVVIPLASPQQGTDYMTGLFQFMCMNSCSLGINRRAIKVIFTLEMSDGEVLGRRVLDIKVCSVIHRDKEKEEKMHSGNKKRQSNDHAPQGVGCKRIRSAVERDNRVYKLEIVGLARYKKCAALLHDAIVGEATRKGITLSPQELEMVESLKLASEYEG